MGHYRATALSRAVVVLYTQGFDIPAFLLYFFAIHLHNSKGSRAL